MSNECTSILMDIASPFSEIFLLFNFCKISLLDHWVNNLNQKVQAQKMDTSRGIHACKMPAQQFWWVWLIRLQRHCY